MKLVNVVFLFSAVILISCKESGPHPSDIVGNYTVKVKLKEGIIDKKSIKEEIRAAMEKAGDDIKEAQKEIEKDLDISSIDTTTIEGKIEYASKSFSKSMAESGLELSKFSTEFGAAISGIAESGLNFSENLLNMVNIEVELQADGDVKAKNSIFNLGFSNAKWEIQGDEFIITKNDQQQPEFMKILKRDDSGFSLEKDNLILEFVKKK